jgi:hypothetical protein
LTILLAARKKRISLIQAVSNIISKFGGGQADARATVAPGVGGQLGRGRSGAPMYTSSGATVGAENLADVIRSLTPEQQESVREFVEFLKRKGTANTSPFVAAVEEFIDQHPELLRRLAQ